MVIHMIKLLYVQFRVQSFMKISLSVLLQLLVCSMPKEIKVSYSVSNKVS
jgi:hypothetical protein